MQHDPELLERLDRLPKESFAGEVFRATRQNLDPLMPSTSGGRWMPRDEAPILYTSLQREGALAEIVFHWSQLTPMPTRPVVLHTLAVLTHRTLKLVRADLAALGMPLGEYGRVNPERTQQIGAAIDYLGCDGLIAPSARWPVLRAHAARTGRGLRGEDPDPAWTQVKLLGACERKTCGCRR